MKTTKCSLGGTEVQPIPTIKEEMMEFMRHQQTITTPFANRPVQPKPKVAVKKYKLVPLTRHNRAMFSLPIRVNVGPFLRPLSKIGHPP